MLRTTININNFLDVIKVLGLCFLVFFSRLKYIVDSGSNIDHLSEIKYNNFLILK